MIGRNIQPPGIVYYGRRIAIMGATKKFIIVTNMGALKMPEKGAGRAKLWVKVDWTTKFHKYSWMSTFLNSSTFFTKKSKCKKAVLLFPPIIYFFCLLFSWETRSLGGKKSLCWVWFPWKWPDSKWTVKKVNDLRKSTRLTKNQVFILARKFNSDPLVRITFLLCRLASWVSA